MSSLRKESSQESATENAKISEKIRPVAVLDEQKFHRIVIVEELPYHRGRIVFRNLNPAKSTNSAKLRGESCRSLIDID